MNSMLHKFNTPFVYSQVTMPPPVRMIPIRVYPNPIYIDIDRYR